MQTQVEVPENMPHIQYAAAAEMPSVEADIAAAPAAMVIKAAVAKPILKQRPRKKKLIKVRWRFVCYSRIPRNTNI